MASPVRSPAPEIHAPLSPEAPKESAVSRLFITPITFLSFLLSLALVDSHNHQIRRKTHSHSPSRSQPSTLLGRVRSILHGLVFKEIDDGPYAYVRSPNLDVQEGEKGRERSASGRTSPDLSPSLRRRSGENGEPWHWHTKQKKMMRAELEDAFRLRKWVVLFLGLVVFSGLGMAVVLGSWIVNALSGSGEGQHVRTDL